MQLVENRVLARLSHACKLQLPDLTDDGTVPWSYQKTKLISLINDFMCDGDTVSVCIETATKMYDVLYRYQLPYIQEILSRLLDFD